MSADIYFSTFMCCSQRNASGRIFSTAQYQTFNWSDIFHRTV